MEKEKISEILADAIEYGKAAMMAIAYSCRLAEMANEQG